MQVAARRLVERCGNLVALGEHLPTPFGERYFLRPSGQTQPRLATARGDALLVADNGGKLLRRVGRAVAKQAVQQEYVEQAERAGDAAPGNERIEVHQPD